MYYLSIYLIILFTSNNYPVLVQLRAVLVRTEQLDLFVAEPQDDVPADQSEAAGQESSVEGSGSLR